MFRRDSCFPTVYRYSSGFLKEIGNLQGREMSCFIVASCALLKSHNTKTKNFAKVETIQNRWQWNEHTSW